MVKSPVHQMMTVKIAPSILGADALTIGGGARQWMPDATWGKLVTSQSGSGRLLDLEILITCLHIVGHPMNHILDESVLQSDRLKVGLRIETSIRYDR